MNMTEEQKEKLKDKIVKERIQDRRGYRGPKLKTIKAQRQTKMVAGGVHDSSSSIRRSYPALKLLASLYRFLSYVMIVVAIGGFIIGLIVCLDGNSMGLGLTIIFATVISGTTLVITYLAVAEGIEISIDIANDVQDLKTGVTRVEVVNLGNLEPNLDLG